MRAGLEEEKTRVRLVQELVQLRSENQRFKAMLKTLQRQLRDLKTKC
jgi:hypothetical protein